MKRLIVWALSLVALGMNAQEVKPERIPWIVERAESSEWYENQIKAWEKVVANEPANENAWYNSEQSHSLCHNGYARRLRKAKTA